MKKEAAPVDPRLDEARDTLKISRGRAAPIWVALSPLRDKRLPIEQRIRLREQLKHLGHQWKYEIDEHIRVSRDLISPAKKELGLSLTQRPVERGARIYMTQAVAEAGGTKKSGKIFAARLVNLTKTIQMREGVTDPPPKVRSPRSKPQEKTLYIAKKPVPNSSL